MQRIRAFRHVESAAISHRVWRIISWRYVHRESDSPGTSSGSRFFRLVFVAAGVSFGPDIGQLLEAYRPDDALGHTESDVKIRLW